MNQKRVRILYFTDPFCSWCWASEPTLLALMEQYGDQVEVQTVMGGMIRDFSDFNDAANGISNPQAVMPHWRMVEERTRQPIDERVWEKVTDPHFSTWPANIAAKAAYLQGKTLGDQYLRRIRRATMTERLVVASPEVLLELAKEIEGLDLARFAKDLNGAEATESFHEDLRLGQAYGVTGFPTMIFVLEDPEAQGEQGKAYLINGFRSLGTYEKALKILMPEVEKKVLPTMEELVKKHGPLTTKELSEVLGLSMDRVIQEGEGKVQAGSLRMTPVSGEKLWMLPEIWS